MADEEISISLKADVKQLTDALKSLPDISNKEARAMVRGIQREYRKAEKAAKSLGEAKKRAAKESDGLRTSMLGAEKIAQGFGGTIGSTAGAVKNFAEGISEAVGGLGPLAKALVVGGGAAGGAAAAVGLIVGAQMALADSALEARKRLQESREFYTIPPGAIESLDRYAAANRELTRSMDEARVAVGSKMADDLAVLKVKVSEGTDNIIESSAATDGWVRSAVRAMSLGVADYWLNNADAEKEATKAGLDTLAAWERTQKEGEPLLKMLDEMAKLNTDAIDPAERLAQRERELAEAERKKAEELREAEKATREAASTVRDYAAALAEGAREINAFYREDQAHKDRMADASQELAEITKSLNEDLLSDADKIIAKYAEQEEAIRKLGAAASDTGELKAAQDALAERRIRDLGELMNLTRKTQLEQDHEAFRERMELDAKQAELHNQAIEEQQEAAQNAAIQTVAVVASIFQGIEDMLTSMSEARLERSQAELDESVAHIEKLRETKAAAVEEGDEAAAQSAQFQIDHHRKSIKMAREQVAEDRAKAQHAAKMARGAAMLSVVANTAAAVMQAFAMFGPPPSPVGIFSAASAAAAGATQAVAVAQAPMPTYFPGSSRVPGGGSAGEIPTTMHGGEAVLNSGAAAELGPQIIDALNAGMEPLQALGGGGGGVLVMDGMVVGRLMADRVRRPGPLRDAVTGGKPVGFVSPFGRN